MKSIEYFLRDEKDKFPYSMPHEDFTDAIANMNATECVLMRVALASDDYKSAMEAIVDSIHRQYAETIEATAQKNFREYTESIYEDFEEARRDAA